MSLRATAYRSALALACMAPLTVPAADETSIRLADGAGVDRVQAYCSMCHSLDYIVMNSPIQDAAGWEKTVNKMVKVMGAPLTAEDVAAVVGYLGTYYGKAPAGT